MLLARPIRSNEPAFPGYPAGPLVPGGCTCPTCRDRKIRSTKRGAADVRDLPASSPGHGRDDLSGHANAAAAAVSAALSPADLTKRPFPSNDSRVTSAMHRTLT
jgi:hypothetical protein